MDVRQFIELIKEAEEQQLDYYNLGAKLIQAQKEADAKLAESMGANSVAAAIRAST
jgi:hypothetical protein